MSYTRENKIPAGSMGWRVTCVATLRFKRWRNSFFLSRQLFMLWSSNHLIKNLNCKVKLTYTTRCKALMLQSHQTNPSFVRCQEKQVRQWTGTTENCLKKNFFFYENILTKRRRSSKNCHRWLSYFVSVAFFAFLSPMLCADKLLKQ